MPDEDNLKFQLEVPEQYLDWDGNLKPEFYEPLFNMLGKEYGVATITGIKVTLDGEDS